MKIIFTTLLLLLGSVAWAVSEHVETDSLVILFGNKTRLVIHSNEKSGIQQLSHYDINKIIHDMGMKFDSVHNGKTFIVIDQNNVQRYLQDTMLATTQKDSGVTVTVKELRGRTDWSTDADDKTKSNRHRSKHRFQQDWNSGIRAAIGLNTLIEQHPRLAYPAETYALQPLGSRYVSLGLGQTPTVVRGRTAALSIYYGLEASWNNYMFENNTLIQKEPTSVRFVDAGRELKKTKLTVCAINLPFVPRVTFYNATGRRIFHLGAGAYVNYRIDSYTKIKEMNNDKSRSHDNFFLTNFRYGLIAHLGIVGSTFFVKYDLNPLFIPGKGPDVRVLSFGIGL